MDTPQTDAPARPDGTCCGQGGSWAPKPGSPFVGGCQLCRENVSGYWARDLPADRQEARLG